MLRLECSKITLTPGEIRQFKERLAHLHAAAAVRAHDMRSANLRNVSLNPSFSTIPRLRRGPERSRDEAVVHFRNRPLYSVASSEGDDNSDNPDFIHNGTDAGAGLSYHYLKADRVEAHGEYDNTRELTDPMDGPAKLIGQERLHNHVGLDVGCFEGLSYHHISADTSETQGEHHRTHELVDPRRGSASLNNQERPHNQCGMHVGILEGLSYHVNANGLETSSEYHRTQEPVNPRREPSSYNQQESFRGKASDKRNSSTDLASTTVEDLINLFDTQITLNGRPDWHLPGPTETQNDNTVGDLDGTPRLPRRFRFTTMSDVTGALVPPIVIHPRRRTRFGEGGEVLASSSHGSELRSTAEDTLVGSSSLPRAPMYQAGLRRDDIKQGRAAHAASLALPGIHVVHSRHLSLPDLIRHGELPHSPPESPDSVNRSILGSRWAPKTLAVLHAARGVSSPLDELGQDTSIYQRSPLSTGMGRPTLPESSIRLSSFAEPQTSPLQPSSSRTPGSSARYGTPVRQRQTSQFEAVYSVPTLPHYGFSQTPRVHPRHGSRTPIWFAGATESGGVPSSRTGRARTNTPQRGYAHYARRPVQSEDQENVDDIERFEGDRQAWLMRNQISAGGVMERTPPRERDFERYLRQ